jgi:hypothetical protein
VASSSTGPDGTAILAVDAEGCARMFAQFASTVETRAPLYGRLAMALADAPDVAGLLLQAPLTQRQPVLLLASVHELLLQPGGADSELARYYPNLTAAPDPGDPMPAFRRFCAARADELHELLATRSTQTNEIGRCALLLPVFGVLAAEMGPLAHLDVGTSAGLNLLLHSYHYRYQPGGEVGPDSPVELTCGTRGAVPVPAELPPVAARRGLDRAPIDPTDPVQRRWLEACVWPDQVDRFVRLRAALEMAAASPPRIVTGDAVEDTPAHVRALAAAGHPVVTNTWVLNYLTGDERTQYLEALEALGHQLDLSWTFAESPALVPELPVPANDSALTTLVLVRWRDGRRTVQHLGTAHPHGYWLHWTESP